MKVINKKAKFDYQLFDRFEAGISLTGPEVKSIKNKRISLKEAYIRFRDGEVFLINANVAPYPFADNRNYDPTRSRKLLLHKKEILRLQKKMEAKNYVLVPTAVYTKGRNIKVEIALAKPKKKWEKRETLRRRDIMREVEKEVKSFRG